MSDRQRRAKLKTARPGTVHIGPPGSGGSNVVDLRKEYGRLCRLYSCEPLDIVAGPLEKVSFVSHAAHLDLRGKGLRGVDCIVLGKLLATNMSIHTLDLSDCLLLPQGWEALLSGLGRNTTLHTLQLRGNNVHGAMVDCLATFLRTNGTLKYLLLEWNCLGTAKPPFASFCTALASNKSLQTLDLRNNRIEDSSAVDLASCLKSTTTCLKDIDLRWNSIGISGAKALWEALSLNESLKRLDIGGNFIPEEMVKAIGKVIVSRAEKAALKEELETRTTLLTRHAELTEEKCKEEVAALASVFEEEETELRTRLRSTESQLGQVEKELWEEKKTRKEVEGEIGELRMDLRQAQEEVKRLQGALVVKERQVGEVESQISLFGVKIKEVEDEAKTLEKENERLQNLLGAKDALLDRIKGDGEEALKKEREKWLSWKEEVESSEAREVRRVGSQLNELQAGMTAAFKMEEGRREKAEEEANRLRMLLLTAKSEGEEALARIRQQLNTEHVEETQRLVSQVEALKRTSESLEVQSKRLDGVIKRLESEREAWERERDGLKTKVEGLEESVRIEKSRGDERARRLREELETKEEERAREAELVKGLRERLVKSEEDAAVAAIRASAAERSRAEEASYWNVQIERRESELRRMKEEDMRRAALLHESFMVYMKSTSAATGLPVPNSCLELLNQLHLVGGSNGGEGTGGSGEGQGDTSSKIKHGESINKTNKNAGGDGL